MTRLLNVATPGALAGVLLFVWLGSASPYAQPQNNPFRTARSTAPSVARADTLACGKLASARAVAPANLDLAEFARAITGTWVRELTWYGQLVVNESALYYSVDAQTGTLTGMMYDQSNLGTGPMYAKLEEIRKSPDRARTTRTMTFLDCDFGIVDKYYKISDGLEFAFGARMANFTAAANQPLKDVFDRMTAQGFFKLDRTELLRRPTVRIAGEKVVNEVLTPSVGGAFWTGSVRASRARGAGLTANVQGVTLQMKGTYRGAHVGDADAGADVQFEGNESAIFFKEGDAFVAASPARRAIRVGPRGAGLAAIDVGGWSTDCGSFFGFDDVIIWERVVIGVGM